MTLFHTILYQKTTEGTYKVRLYAVPTGTAVRLATHAAFLGSVGIWDDPPVIDSIVLDPIGSIGVEAESEFAQGTPKFDTLKLGFLADEALVPLVQAVRDPAMDVWCEVTLDQTSDLPDRNFTKPWSLWPAQVRSIYWGRLERGSLQGHVTHQRWTKKLFERILRRFGLRHDGSLSVEFVHWLKIIGEADVRSVLDAWVGTNPGTTLYKSWYDFLRFICSAIAPGGLPELIDWRLKDFGQLEIDLWPGYTSGTYASVMNDCSIRVWDSGNKSPLFDSSSSPNDNSFYKWKDVAEALIRIAAEFQLFPQVEIPCMEDVTRSPKSVRTTFLFASLVHPPVDVYLDHDEQTIAYTPASAYARQYKATQPHFTDQKAQIGISTNYKTYDGPMPTFSIVKSAWRDGTDQEFTTLTRLLGTKPQWVSGAFVEVADIEGIEIFVLNNLGQMVPAVIAYSPQTHSEYTQWSAAHAESWMRRWGTTKSIVELKAKGVGLEPFGTSTSTDVERTYGLLDWSAFPLYRKFTARVGLLSNPGKITYGKLGSTEESALNPDLEYIVIACKRTPNGGTEYKLLEIGTADGSQLSEPIDEAIDLSINSLPNAPLLQTNGTDNPTQNKLNLMGGTGVTIVDDGLGNITFTGGGGVTLKTNGVANSDQTNLDITAGTGISLGYVAGVLTLTNTGGTVTSVAASGGTTGLTLSGGPITGSGTFTLAGTLAVANGGTGATTATAATTNLLPSQTGNTGKYLTTDGLGNLSWIAAGGLASANTWTGAQTVEIDGITTTYTDGLVLKNATATTSGVTVQEAPGLSFKSRVWQSGGGAQDIPFEARTYAQPASGTSPQIVYAIDSVYGANAAQALLRAWDQGRCSLGGTASAGNNFAVAIGHNATASGTAAICIGGNGTGESATATATGTISIGANVNATNTFAIGIGKNSTVSGSGAVSLGVGNTAAGGAAFALGNNATANGANQTVIGANNTILPTSASASFVSTDPALIIGNGNGTTQAARSYAAYITFDGSLVLGGRKTTSDATGTQSKTGAIRFGTANNTTFATLTSATHAADRTHTIQDMGQNANVGMYSLLPPLTATSPGEAGMYSFDSSYFYICTSHNTWVRVAHATF